MAYSETQEHVCAILVSVFALPRGGAGWHWSCGLVRPQGCCLWRLFIRTREGDGRGILVQPRGRNGRHLEGVQRSGAKHLVHLGRKERIEHLPQAVIVKRVPPEALL